MIIGACGYGGTGSSIITDLLTEYDDVEVYDTFEFIVSYIADGLEDLEYHLMKQYSKGESSDVAMRRFLRRTKWYNTPFIHKPCNGKLFQKYSEEFIEEITQCKFRGMYSADTCTGYVIRDIFAFALKKVFMPKVIEKITKKRSYLWPCHEIRYSIEPDNFYVAAQRYTTKIIKAMGADLSKVVCLDQPFTGNAPENSMKYFKDSRAIVVDRDPRDMYLAEKYTVSPDGKFAPKGDVKAFVLYYENMRKHIHDHPNILRIRFEELIYEYDQTVGKIEKFLNLSEHKRPKTMFDPSRSISNTQLVRLYPNDHDEIKKIEEMLEKYLFPFDHYPDVVFKGNPFDGASRKLCVQNNA